MRKTITRLMVAIMSLTFSPATLLAAETGTTTTTPGKIHHFTIIAPPTAKVGEAVDVTVEAKDKDDKIITNYRGSIFFACETDFAATLPAQGRAIQFKESDNGVLKTVKGTVFKRVGKQELTVSEALEDVGGSITIMVEDITQSASTGSTETVTITFPEKGTSVTTDTITMSGKSRKNSKVVVKLNGKELGFTQTDDTGSFTYKITGINQQTNILSASVHDGSDAVIGTSETTFNFGSKAPVYYNTSIRPAQEVESGTGITLTIDGEPGLASVTVAIDGTSLPAKEGSPGKYSVTTVAPAKSGVYPIGVTMKNILAQTTEKAGVISLTVKEKSAPPVNTGATVPKATFKNVIVTMEGAKVNLNFSVDNLPTDTAKFKIVYGDSADTLTNEAMTYELDKIRRPNGTYNWYIPDLTQKTYIFKIFGVKADGALIADFVSEPQTFIVGKQGSCTIGNIPAVTADTYPDKTVLTWPALTGAISYNVYRVTATRDYELVKNVTENSYTINLSAGTITYADFAVKALCDTSTESATPTVASRVQTGPGALAILVVLASLGSVLLMRRKMI